MEKNDSKRARATGLLVIALWTIATIVGAYAAHVPMPHNPIQLPYEKSLGVALFLPEGWKFFTRDPREDKTYLMVRTPDGWAMAPGSANGSLENALGANRKGRARNVELGALIGQVEKTDWTECQKAPGACLDGVSKPVRVKAVQRQSQLCGLRGVVAQKPVPWAWRNADPPVVMPSRVLLLDVRC